MDEQLTKEEITIVNKIAENIHFWLKNEYNFEVDEIANMRKVVKIGLQKGKDLIKNSTKNNLNQWIAKVLFDAGYKKQCMILEPFEAETEKEAVEIANAKVAEFFKETPNAVVYEIKISKKY